MDIPLTNSLDIPNDYLKGIEIEGGHSIESDVEEDE